ncbi:reverse transcriptase-like protein [Plakobranchus ocellatus]|uniref:Reverse transcriptase-like protein n=1 Tax=Plakobranchus ocellatus TaxID=259542 RepID=A0AAV4BZP0_9GAST|nr:reverse transcriptase-like protein [Plakobranchus ocellatus]
MRVPTATQDGLMSKPQINQQKRVLKRPEMNVVNGSSDACVANYSRIFVSLGEFVLDSTYVASLQQGDLRLSVPPSGQGADGGARIRDRRVPTDLRADSLATVPPTPHVLRVKSRCIVNNTVSDWFLLERGCRQGDPISLYLFLIASEILASIIRQNGHIKGYKINGIEIKVSQYADDTTIFLDGSESAFEKCIETLGEFEKYSGLKMYQDKTKVIWFRCPRPPETIYLPILQFDWNPRKFSV